MKTYKYTFTFIQQSLVDVEAESEEQAQQMIEKMTYDLDDVIAFDWWNTDIELQEVIDYSDLPDE
jgi:hypothetical protein